MEQSSEKTLIDFFSKFWIIFSWVANFFPFFSFFFKSSESMFHQQLFAAGETRRFSTSINQKFTQRNGAKSFLLMNEASKNAQIPFFFFLVQNWVRFKRLWGQQSAFPFVISWMWQIHGGPERPFFWTSAILEWMGRKFLEQFLPMKVTC